LPHLKESVRWDVFEENFIALLLDKMNFSNDLLNKISWKTFLTYIMEECSERIKENTEVPIPASNPSLIPYYKGLFVKKSRFLVLVGEDGVFKGL
jgi:hypothetical protein